MRTTSLTWLLLLACCRQEPTIARAQGSPTAEAADLPAAVMPAARSQRPPSVVRKPNLWSHVHDWPDPVAVVDGTPIARKDLVADLQVAVEGGVLDAEVGEVMGLRAAATALEARIDALIVQQAIGKDAAQAQAGVDTALAREIGQAGSRENWLKILLKRGMTAESHLRTLTTEAQLHVLVERETPFAVTDAELRERYESEEKSLTVPAAVRVLEVAEALPVTPTDAQVAQAQARVAAAVKAGKWSTPERGWQTQRELGKERWAAVQTLQVGGLTPPVRTGFGVHQLKLVAQRTAHKPTFAEAKQQLAAYVQRMKWVRLDAILLAKLRGAAKVQRFSPFDHPPGGLPLAGAVTMAEFEEEDD